VVRKIILRGIAQASFTPQVSNSISNSDRESRDSKDRTIIIFGITNISRYYHTNEFYSKTSRKNSA